MPIHHVPRPARSRPSGESFTLKALLVVSALILSGLLLVQEEFYFSSPAHSLSETEAALRLAAK
jgi:hypothetical protein